MAREGGGRTTRKTILGLEKLSANRPGADVRMATVIAAKGICPIAHYPALSTHHAAYAFVGGRKARAIVPAAVFSLNTTILAKDE